MFDEQMKTKLRNNGFISIAMINFFCRDICLNITISPIVQVGARRYLDFFYLISFYLFVETLKI